MIHVSSIISSVAAVFLVVLTLIPTSAHAQQPNRPPQSLRESAIALALKAANDTPAGKLAAPAVPATATRRERSVGRKILGGVLGGTAGFFAGGYLGAAIEGDRCNCDDPGLQGALLGAPIGAAIGAILGVRIF